MSGSALSQATQETNDVPLFVHHFQVNVPSLPLFPMIRSRSPSLSLSPTRILSMLSSEPWYHTPRSKNPPSPVAENTRTYRTLLTEYEVRMSSNESEVNFPEKDV